MITVRLYNSLTKQIDPVVPWPGDSEIGIYTCGPTVYSYVTIGNWRTYYLSDVVARLLKSLGYQIKTVMNITDVGHLTGDNLGDADTGEDRLEAAATKEGRTAWDVAQHYTEDFLRGSKLLRLQEPDVRCKATDHIDEQLEMIQTLMNAGFGYQISDGIYFDTTAYEKAGYDYGQLTTLDEVREGARVEPNKEKRNPRDFALWKFSLPEQRRHMEWQSPWGTGFPGWHIECSAMGMKYLGDQFALHLGGEDLRSTHHPNEIAQSQGSTGKKPFVKHWVHGAFLKVDGKRMGKSLGNAYTLDDLIAKGFDPLDLRYFYSSGHYRKPLNFTFDALAAAREGRLALVEWGRSFQADAPVHVSAKAQATIEEFYSLVADDLKLPQALAFLHELRRSKLSREDAAAIYQAADALLVFGSLNSVKVPSHVEELARRRQQLRAENDFEGADRIRKEIESQGFVVKDTESGYTLSRLVSR